VARGTSRRRFGFDDGGLRPGSGRRSRCREESWTRGSDVSVPYRHQMAPGWTGIATIQASRAARATAAAEAVRVREATLGGEPCSPAYRPAVLTCPKRDNPKRRSPHQLGALISSPAMSTQARSSGHHNSGVDLSNGKVRAKGLVMQATAATCLDAVATNPISPAGGSRSINRYFNTGTTRRP
jgi:hypothetical protein